MIVVCLMGATATGKTDVAIRLSERFDIDIISVDSAMVYHGLDIGTGKPDKTTLARVPHGLVDIRDANERYSVYEFLGDAWRLVRTSHANGRVPMLVGGTMLYFHAFAEGLAELPEGDPAVRADIEARGREEGWNTLHEELKASDACAAANIAPENAARITRALEVAAITGKPISWWWQTGNRRGWRGNNGMSVLEADLQDGDRHRHWQRMADRLKAMFRAGFVDEVKRLRASGLGLTAASLSMRAVGYRQIWQGLEAGASESAMFDAAFTATRRLAKRQRTWLRRFSGALPFDCTDQVLDTRLSTVLQDRLMGHTTTLKMGQTTTRRMGQAPTRSLGQTTRVGQAPSPVREKGQTTT